MDELRDQIVSGQVEPEVLEDLTSTVGYLDDMQLLAIRTELLEPLLQLDSRQVPPQLVAALLRGVNLHDSLKYAPPDSLKLEGSPSDKIVLELLADKVTQADVAGTSSLDDTPALIARAVGRLADPELSVTEVSSIERLAKKLSKWHSLIPLIPFLQLYNGTAEQQARLMSLNKFVAEVGDMPPDDFQIWPLKDSDMVLQTLRIQYTHEFMTAAAPRISASLEGAVHEAAQMYPTGYQYVDSELEELFVATARYCEPLFMTIDSHYPLLSATTKITMLARIPAAYIVKYHPDMLEQLELSESTLPAFANLVGDPSGFQLLDFNAARINRLTLPAKLELAVAATRNKDVAPYFVARFPAMFAQIADWTPKYGRELDLKTRLVEQFRDAGIRPPAATASVATASGR